MTSPQEVFKFCAPESCSVKIVLEEAKPQNIFRIHIDLRTEWSSWFLVVARKEKKLVSSPVPVLCCASITMNDGSILREIEGKSSWKFKGKRAKHPDNLPLDAAGISCSCTKTRCLLPFNDITWLFIILPPFCCWCSLTRCFNTNAIYFNGGSSVTKKMLNDCNKLQASIYYSWKICIRT